MTARPGVGDALASLAGRLTAQDRWLLRMLHEHTVLTTTHLHRLGWFATLRQVQGRARTLRGLEVVDGFQPRRDYGYGTHPLHLVLGPFGARVVAAEVGVTVADLGYRGRARALTVTHRLSLGHDIGVTDLVCDLATTPGIEVVRWWSARRCGHYFGHHVRPDAYLALTTHPTHNNSNDCSNAGRGRRGWGEMFLEYDTGSENLTQLTAKVAGYHALAEFSGVVTPVGVWFTRPRREPTARRALADALRALPSPGRVPILTGAPHTHPSTGAGGGAGGGAGARVWLPLHPGCVERVDLTAITSRPHPPAPAGHPSGPGAALGGRHGAGSGVMLPDPPPSPPRRGGVLDGDGR